MKLCLLNVCVFLAVFAYSQAAVYNMHQNEIEKREEQWTKPAFCNNLDCPKYTVMKKGKDYELRKYAAAKWVSTNLSGVEYGMSATRTMFMRLFNYISGENAAKAKVPMTCPVTTRFLHGQGPACVSNFTMSFYVPNPEAPAPTNKNVTFTEMPETLVYVRQFGGYYINYDAWVKEAMQLASDIGNEDLFHTNFWYTAGYNAPFQLFNRHNEVWLFAK